MLNRLLLSAMAMSCACAFLVGCDSARSVANCEQSLGALTTTVSSFGAVNALKPSQAAELDEHISKVTKTCDTSRMEVAAVLISAFKIKGATDQMAQYFESIRPENEAESELVYFRAAEFFIDVRKRDKALAYLTKLEALSRDPDMADTARVEFECVFDRCGLAFDAAERLATKYPDIVGYHAFLALSHADRHEFPEAAREFDKVLASGGIGMFDSRTALIAIAAFSNAGQKEKAAELYGRFSQVTPVEIGVNDLNFKQMKDVVEDKSGRMFLFSDWPPTGN